MCCYTTLRSLKKSKYALNLYSYIYLFIYLFIIRIVHVVQKKKKQTNRQSYSVALKLVFYVKLNKT